MIKPGQIERANARAELYSLPIVVLRPGASGGTFDFEVVSKLNEQLAKDNLAAFTFDKAGIGLMHWDGPELLDPTAQQFVDWAFERARQVAGIPNPNPVLVLAGD